MLPKIELNSRDLEITTLKTGKHTGQKIVRIKYYVGIDEAFIKEMSDLGVQEYEYVEETENV